MAWTWIYLDPAGAQLEADAATSLTAAQFPTQADAEAWVGESWHDLVADGVDAVTLMHDDTVHYGPMSLKPAE